MDRTAKPHRVVYTIVERKNKKFWLRIGASFRNHDGSENVVLDAMPTNGQLQIRDYVPWDDSRKRPGSERDADPAELFGERAALTG